MKTILIVEDIELNRELLAQLLEEDHRLVFAEDGVAALERAAETRPDLILMDLSLPRMDGWEATRRLKADPAMARHSRDRAVGPRHERRRRTRAGQRLRRLPDQADRRDPVVPDTGEASWQLTQARC